MNVWGIVSLDLSNLNFDRTGVMFCSWQVWRKTREKKYIEKKQKYRNETSLNPFVAVKPNITQERFPDFINISSYWTLLRIFLELNIVCVWKFQSLIEIYSSVCTITLDIGFQWRHFNWSRWQWWDMLRNRLLLLAECD